MFSQLADLCRGHTVYIQTHNFPDPDAIASAFGLQKLLEIYDIPSTLCYEGQIDKLSSSKMLEEFPIEMVPYDQLKASMRPEDYIICVDSQKHSGYITDFVGDEVACIDHHPTSESAKSVEYLYRDVQEDLGACATLIAGYYASLKLEPSPDVATALLYGLKMDTLQFTRKVTEQDIQMFQFLFPFCDEEKLNRLGQNNMELEDLKAYGAAITSMEIYGRVGFSHIPFPCPDAMIAILADFILSLVEVEVAVVSSQREDGIKISVRSEVSSIHAGNLIHDALEGVGGGGGHPPAAAGRISPDKLPLLGKSPEHFIRERFTELLKGTQVLS